MLSFYSEEESKNRDDMSVGSSPSENNDKVTIEIASDMEVEELQSDQEAEFEDNTRETEQESEQHQDPKRRQSGIDDLSARGMAPPKARKSSSSLAAAANPTADKETRSSQKSIEKTSHESKGENEGKANANSNARNKAKGEAEKKEKPQESNPYEKKENNNKNGTWSMKDAVLGEKREKASGTYNFRVRILYKTEQKNNLPLSLALEKHRLLKKVAAFMKLIDDEGRITAWDASGKNDFVACNIDKLSPYTADKYVGMPNGRKTLGTSKNRIGFRINSNLTLH